MPDTEIPNLIETLTNHRTPVTAEDAMSEAGRKILLADFVKMLTREEGVRTGESIADVHQMRVATRRMRSALRLLEPYYAPDRVRSFERRLQRLARVLGKARDLDVMIKELKVTRNATLTDEGKAALETIIDQLQGKRERAQGKLIKYLDSGKYNRWVKRFTRFLTVEGKDALPVNPLTPYQVRHVIPTILHEHLGIVRAYSTTIPEPARRLSEFPDNEVASLPEMEVLHQLRIEVKRLRYAIAHFADVLGTGGEVYVRELKTLQDHLGQMNDIEVAEAHLQGLVDKGALEADIIAPYIEKLHADMARLQDEFPAVWKRFNTRTVQSRLSDALLTLR